MAEVWQIPRNSHIDNTIGFKAQSCDEVDAKARRKLSLIKKISGKKWGGSTGDMRRMSLASDADSDLRVQSLGPPCISWYFS